MMLEMGRPKKYNYPDHMTYDRSWNKYIVRNPVTRKSKRFSDESEAREAADALNEWLRLERQRQALEAGRPTIGGIVEWWKRDRLQFMPWDSGTRKNHLARMDRLAREHGHRALATTDCMFLEDWLSSFCETADQFNKWRYALILLWQFAVSRKLVQSCEPEKIEKRSTSKKLDMNRKRRSGLTLEGFRAIHKVAPPFLQIAMEQSLVTLQSRTEICNMQHAHYRDGFLYVIRDKTSADSDMAFIKIAVTEQLEDIRRRSLDNTVSPYLVHRRPERNRREWREGKPHWTYVNPAYLSRAFAEARDASEFYAHLTAKERPTFHEIRGLGARLYEDMGMSKAAIQALMTHTSKRTTQIYLDGGSEALRDDDFLPVAAPMKLTEVLPR